MTRVVQGVFKTRIFQSGIISALPRMQGNILAAMELGKWIQTDAVINLGNSGGALVNQAGELIGVNTALVSPNAKYMGYGYAVPVNTVRSFTEPLIENWRKENVQ